MVFAQDTTKDASLTTRVLTLTDTQPIAQGMALLLGGLSLYVAALLARALRQRYPITWRASVRLAGWIVPLITAAVTLIMILNRDKVQLTPMISMSVLQLVIPLGAAIHTALIFSPEDEPLEMLLALPRPITWLVLERVLVIVALYAGIGIGGMGLLAAQNRLGDIGMRLGAWLPSMLFLMSFTIYLTTRVRTMTMGLIGALAVWAITLLFGPFLIPSATNAGPHMPFPMNYVQPFLWTINMFAQPLSFPAWEYYTLNRVILLGLSVFFLWRTSALLSDAESLLLSAQDRQTRRKAAPVAAVSNDKRSKKFNSAPVAVNVFWQIAAMWLYEWKLHWRRRPLKVMLSTLIAVVGITMLIAYDAYIKVMLQGADLSQLALDQQMIAKGLAFTHMPLAMLTVMQMLVVPVILCDAIPLDQQDHMDEMLHSTPLPGWAYLVGKIGGLWWAAMSAFLLALTILSGLWFLAVGPFDLRPVLDSWLLLGAPIVLFNGGFAALIGATQPTRRRAAIAVIGVFFLSLYIGGQVTDGFLAALQLNPFNSSVLVNAFGSLGLPLTFSSLFTLPGMSDFMVGRGMVFLITALIVGGWWTLRWNGFSLWPKTISSSTPTPIAASQSN